MKQEEISISSYIEHTYLQSNTDSLIVERICKEAIENNFYGVCIPPFFVPKAAELLADTEQKIITVAGFPMGYANIFAKVEEMKRAINEGADEIDVVANIAAVKDGNWSHVKNDIQSLTSAAHLKGKIIKIILETALLTNDELKQLCDICNQFEVNFVKTATGFSEVNTSPEVIRTLKSYISKDIKIKASGGIGTTEAALALINAGADRIGASRSLKIIGL